VGVEFVIPFYLEDNIGDDIVSGVVPYAIIRRISDNKYYNSSTGLWQDSSYSILLNHYFEGIWCYTFLPDQQDIYVIKCNENTYSIRDGVVLKTVDRLSLLDNLDTTISSRLSTTDYDSKIDIIDSNVDIINSNVSSIKGIVDTNLDTTVSSRSTVTDEEIWMYNIRTLTPENESGIGDYSLTINVSVDEVITEGVNVFVYDSNRIAINQAVTDSFGQVIFWLDAGDYYIDYQFNGVYGREIFQTISDNTVINEDLESIIADDNLLIDFRELNSGIVLENGNSVTIGIEAYGNGTFVVNSATAIVTGIEESVTCNVVNKKIYATFTVVTTGWVTVKLSVIIGGNSLPFEKRYWVD
jgi:hypothetical protein